MRQPPDVERAAPAETGNGGSLENNRLGGAVNSTSSKFATKCKRCGRAFKRERLEQKYCCARCRNAAVKARVRARSGDKKASRRHLLVPHREAVTFGQKKPTKTKAIFDPLQVNFRLPVIDFLRRGDDLLSLVVQIECWRYPPLYRRAPLRGDDVELEYYPDGLPKLPAFLDRRASR
jgi:hypothetical protein